MQAREGEGTEREEQVDEESVERILGLVERANIRAIARRRRRFRRRVYVLLTAVLALCAAAAVRFSFAAGGTQTSKAPHTSTDSASRAADHSKAPATHVAHESKASGAESIPDFVWVPAKGAVHYRVEFLLGSRVLHTAKTSAPRLHVPASSLPAGRYRWRVWALDSSGARVGRPIVDASVNVR